MGPMKSTDHCQHALSLLAWSPWQPLYESWLAGRLPDQPGLYRIRRAGRSDLDYIGQTGMGRMTLRKRSAMLSGVFADTMPYRDPHTAGPALWALRHASSDEALFEISVVPIAGETPWRKGLECPELVYRAKEVKHTHDHTSSRGA